MALFNIMQMVRLPQCSACAVNMLPDASSRHPLSALPPAFLPHLVLSMSPSALSFPVFLFPSLDFASPFSAADADEDRPRSDSVVLRVHHLLRTAANRAPHARDGVHLARRKRCGRYAVLGVAWPRSRCSVMHSFAGRFPLSMASSVYALRYACACVLEITSRCGIGSRRPPPARFPAPLLFL